MSERLADYTRSVSTAARGLTFSRFAKAIAVARGDLLAAAEFADAKWPGSAVAFATKTAVSAMSTGNSGGLGAPRAIVDDFLELMRPRSLIDRIVGWRRVPMNTSILQFTGDATAYVTPEGGPKPIAKFDLARVTLVPQKGSAIVVVTDETLKRSDGLAELSLGTELARALGAQLDRRAFNPNFGDSIAAGGTVLDSSGSSLAAIDSDLRAMLAIFATADAALDTAVWIMSPTTAGYLATLRGTAGAAAYPEIGIRGGKLLGAPVYVSSALIAAGSPAEGAIVLVDPTQVLVADEGQADVQLARSASIQLSDSPTDSATSTVSLWQSNLVALRAERWLSWKCTSASAAAVLDNVAY